MNRKVLQTMIYLLWAFLIAFSFAKMLFAERFVASIDNENIILIGSVIDGNIWIRLGVDTALSVLVMHFYVCACKQRWVLHPLTYLAFSIYAISLNALYITNPVVAMNIDLIGMIVVPLILKADIHQTVFIFVLQYAGQAAVLFIRSEPLYIASTDYATQFLLMFDMYIWLVLYYLYANMYKEVTLWEKLSCRFSAISRPKSWKKNS